MRPMRGRKVLPLASCTWVCVCVCVLKRAPRFLVGFGGGTPQPDHQFGGSNLTKKTHLHVLWRGDVCPWHALKADTEVICATMLLSQAATRRINPG